ncbi:helix-turn-helix transcriptional regulator [Compostimonas suwonensis]|uniref:Putative DNA-binding transcriptional regulator YafY n=1 Tax=Compostimonas suwonensis TaxID=1048394 RepID=A0A2M9BU59_9MICO|nr:YafY family protein [Compostimonas suwonensis]PJJ61479.1 putative DNA-binding transcriptional regulator YafY [Compostimonas suwonensis]
MSDTTARTLELLSLLQTHRHWAGPELAERLGVSGRTLRRDIDRLRELGYRVGATRGAIGGYQLEAGSELPPLLLTEDEAVAIAVGLSASAQGGLEGSEHLTLSAIAKLEQVLPAHLRRRVAALQSHTLPMSLWQAGAGQQGELPQVAPELLGQLALVCRDRERVRFRYEGTSYEGTSGARSDRLVEPHALVSAERRWYLVAWDLHRDDWRTFRVDRIDGLFPTRVRFAERELPAADAAEFVAAAISSLKRRHVARVILDVDIDGFLAHFGVWGSGAEPVAAATTMWPIGGYSYEEMASALYWIPEGMSYRVEAEPGFLDYLGRLGRVLVRAASTDRDPEKDN